jgi:hypothetical protein
VRVAIILLLFFSILVACSNIITAVGSSNYISPQEVTYLGPIVIENYTFNRLTLTVLTLNPVVYFEYRNVYVVPHNNTRYGMLRVRDVAYSQLISSRLDQLVRLLNDSELSANSIQLEDNIIYIDLSNVPISRVLNTAGQVFSDISGVVVFCDKRFIDTVTRQFEYRDLLNKLEFSSEIKDLLMQLARDLISRGLFSMLGGPGSSNTPIGKWFRFLAHIGLTGSYSEARDIIEGYVKELAEIARKYIPEDVPLYVLVSEYSSPFTPDVLNITSPPPDVQYGTPLENTNTTNTTNIITNTNTTSPDYPETSQRQSSQLNSLVWVAPIIVISTILVVLYVIKRSSLTSM